jgi:magnesium-transporting ATPase (P-type)
VVTSARTIEVSGVGYAPDGGFSMSGKEVDARADTELIEIARAALLCNDAAVRAAPEGWQLDGDPTEGALHVLALKAGLEPRYEGEQLPRIDVIAFESEHRFMATLHHDHAGHAFVLLKGAPERVLELCAMQREEGTDRKLDRGYWSAAIESSAARGQRVLGLAMLPAPPDQRTLEFADVEGGFSLLGLVGIIDPPRDEAIAAVARCHRAGIRVKMITGDHAVTAAAIAAQLGIGRGRPAVSGVQLDAMSDADLQAQILHTDVFARASPEHKLRLVQALQAHGEVVAMTGDGVNDSPALKRADVGVAMGMKGTEAAKEASDMVVADDNFASIAHAVEEGRTVYDNIRKFLLFMLPTNGGEAGALVVAILLGLTLPITPVQILWVNMVTAITLGLALAFEPAEADIMRRPPRPPTEPILSRFLVWRIAFVTLLLTAGTLGLFLWETSRGTSLEQARTIAVNTLAVGELVYLFNSRYLIACSLSWNGLFGNRYAVWAALALVPMQLALTYVPAMQWLFGTASLGVRDWLLVLGFGLALFLAVELEKAVTRRRQAAVSAPARLAQAR